MATVEQVASLQQQLEQNRQHTSQLVTSLENVRNEASAAVAELRRQLAEVQQLGGGGGRDPEDPERMNLLNLRTLEPKVFSGSKDSSYKVWAKRIKTYCNVQKDGFRKAMEWAESEDKTVDMDIMVAPWSGRLWATTSSTTSCRTSSRTTRC